MTTLKINHYLNTKLKPFDRGDGKLAYPVYVRILWGREVIRIKSILANRREKLDDYLTKMEFDLLNNKGVFDVEIEIIKHIHKNVNSKVSLQEIIKMYLQPMTNIVSNAIYIEFDIEFKNYGILEFEDNFRSSIRKYLIDSLQNNNSRFIEKSISIKIENFDLIDNFDFLKKDPKLKTICEIVKYIAVFDQKFYSSKDPLNLYEWTINNGSGKFNSFISETLKNDPIYRRLMKAINTSITATDQPLEPGDPHSGSAPI